MSAALYQKELESKLKKIFSPQQVRREWSVWKNAQDGWSDRSTYAPRLDLALGPFNTSTENKFSDIEKITRSAEHTIIRRIIKDGQHNNTSWSYNSNPRCLLAIEIEFSGSSKHILGDYTNASMMGYVGIVISSASNYEKIRRVGEYTKRLRELEKSPNDLFCNVVIYKPDEFIDLLSAV